MKIEVKNCGECPFNNKLEDYEYCNLDTNIESNAFSSLPGDKVHEDCPMLKDKEIIVFTNEKRI